MAFVKGQSGNPAGRRPGSRNKRLALLRSAEPSLLRKLVKMARSGDMAAMKIIADRLWPRLRSEAALIRIPEGTTNLANFGNRVLALLAAGRMPPDAASEVLRALAAQAQVVEHTEWDERIRALEDADTESAMTALLRKFGTLDAGGGEEKLPRRVKGASNVRPAKAR